ncbi:MAG: LysM peptidoglycan-binding domain-containing protein [Haliea sp.]|uniref:LysM peptidoglycan-binding domain-containing protein n=1 Tax=Haliea sp. TaxID=1932666 RepID=UPI0032ED45EE
MLSALLSLAGCQALTTGDGSGERRDAELASRAQQQASNEPLAGQAGQLHSDDLWERLRQGMEWELPDNGQVRIGREYYLGQHGYFETVAERGALYLHHIVEEIERRDMPLELALLPFVESTLDPFALSSQKAMGLWQIMPATGRNLGIESDWWYDGRRDLRESTAAALDYLQYLHDTLDGDWLLAIAAYNSGEGRVGRAVSANRASGRDTDFWSLPLPAETRKHVRRLLALSSLVAEPDAWELSLPPLTNAPAFVPVPTGGQIDLARAAELADVELATLQALNPGHLRWATSPEADELLVPREQAELFQQRVAALSPEERLTWQHYRVQRGDSLLQIAQAFGTRVDVLRQANGIKGSLVREGVILMVPRDHDPAAAASGGASPGLEARDYKVRRGDSLYRIAGRFKVKVADLIAWNSLSPTGNIHPGQQLTVYVRGG